MLLETRKADIGLRDRHRHARRSRAPAASSPASPATPCSPTRRSSGRNAFAHESGIHQDGVLKERTTYEIMDATTVGLDRQLDRARQALRPPRAQAGARGARLRRSTAQALNQAFKRFKDVADRKKQVTAMDLEALVTDELRDGADAWTLEWFEVEASNRRPPHARVGLTRRRRRRGRPATSPATARSTRSSAPSTPPPMRDAKLRDFRIGSVGGGPGRARRGERGARARRPVRVGPGRLHRHHRGGRAGLRARAVELRAARRARGRADRGAAERRRVPHDAGLVRSGAPPRRRPCGRAAATTAARRRGVHEVRAHRLHATPASGATIRVAHAAGAQHLQLGEARRPGRRRAASAAAPRPPPRPKVGSSASTSPARPTGAASRLDMLQTPPSTYSRPPISTGGNSHGTEQDASTASATVASGAPGAPNTTRLPVRAVDGGDAQAAVEARRAARCTGPRSTRRAVGRGAARSSAARAAAPPGARGAQRQRHQRRGRRRGDARAPPRAGAARPGRRLVVDRRLRRRASCTSSGSAVGQPPGGRGARRRTTPAEVPTKYSQRAQVEARALLEARRPCRAARRCRACRRRRGRARREASAGGREPRVAHPYALYAITYKRLMAVAPHRSRPRPAHPRPARGVGPVPARPRGALAASRAPMLSQVERGETSPTLQVAARIAARPRPAAVPAAAPRRGRRGLDRARATSAAARASDGHAYEILTPAAARPARRGHPAHARARRARTGDAPMHEPGAARRSSSRAAPSRSSATATATTCTTGDSVTFDADLPAPLREPRKGGGGPARRAVGGTATLMSQTLLDKIWAAHEVAPGLHLHRPAPRPRGDQPAGLRRPAARRPQGPPARPHARDRRPQRPHGRHARSPRKIREAAQSACRSRRSRPTARSSASPSTRLGSERQGIVHIIGPELGVTQPGMTIVCGDSPHRHARRVRRAGVRHRHVARSSTCSPPRRSRSPSRSRCASSTSGEPGPGVTAKDMILGTIGQMGTGGAAGHAVEYAGPAIEALSMEGRMTVCNMTIEGGGRAGMIAPDETTFEWICGRAAAPEDFEAAVAEWRELRTDDGATFDQRDRGRRRRAQPDRLLGHDARRRSSRSRARCPQPSSESEERALTYMALEPGTPIEDDQARPRLHRLLHERPHRRPARRRVDARRPARCTRTSARWSSRARDSRPPPGRGRGPRRDVPRRRLRVAHRRLLDVPGHERGHPRPRRALRVDLEPQLRGPPGPRRPHAPRLPADGRRRGDRGALRRHPGVELHGARQAHQGRRDGPRPRRRRHGPDHPRASTSSASSGPASASSCSTSGARTRPSSCRRTRSSPPGRTSAAARAASTRRGRSRTTASRPSSRRRFADIFFSNCLKIGLLPVRAARGRRPRADGGRRGRGRPGGARGPLRRHAPCRSRSRRTGATGCSTASTTSR